MALEPPRADRELRGDKKAPIHLTRLQGRRGNIEVKSDKSLMIVRD